MLLIISGELLSVWGDEKGCITDCVLSTYVTCVNEDLCQVTR